MNEEKEYVNYTEMVTSIMEARSMSSPPLAYTHTYGCQGNVADGEIINGMLSEMGFRFTDDMQKADFILFNTCAVREHAEDRVFGNVGALKHIKRKNPNTVIALCGCMVQQEHIAEKIRRSYPHVDLVFGTHVIKHFPKLLFETLTGGQRVFEISGSDGTIAENLPLRRDGTVKAWLPIMYGCNNFCSYCVVPYVRGRERSRRSSVLIKEAENIIKAGYKEITLLGQNVNSYGANCEGELNFSELIRKMDEIEGDFLIRFMTSHPKDCTEELIDTIAQCKHTAHHLHLPFQAGSNRILREMNRKYTIERYIEIVEAARRAIPDLSITSDVIVGFPGETYEEFSETLDVIRRVKFTSLYTFIYSAREGTAAAKMDDPIPYEEKSAWLRELLSVQEEIAAERTALMVGQVVRVLVEGETKSGDLSCRTSNNLIVEVKGDLSLVGSFIYAEITEALNWILRGKIADM
ncbi:MAG: tRNA (N6-isopentenyl adenosine(37)-C2)-methylthiotransferase MiaB [Oscillospiraceae bacterium]|nr:tRNA (N6-isopentenyl adenosine(37)-C2)-methylthiotransferase MiaB [Oscillospiraceae bacterium]